MALYDANGSRVNLGLTDAYSVGSAADLSAGSCGVISGNAYISNTGESPAKMFDNDTTTKLCLPYRDANQTSIVADRGNPSSWIYVVFRLADNAAPVSSYLLANTKNEKHVRGLTDWSLECSADGVTWKNVSEMAQVDDPATANTWYNDGAPYPVLGGSKAEGLAADASEVSVADGATLELLDGSSLAQLTIDMTGDGTATVKNFRGAENGALYIRNAASLQAVGALDELPITLVDPVKTPALKTWKVYVNGVLTDRTVSLHDGKLSIEASGLMVIVR